MITFQRLTSYVEAKPFRAFRVKMTSGQIFEIRHPEMIFPGRTSSHIHTFVSNDKSQSDERVREISLLLIEYIELLDVPMPQEP